MFLDELRDGPPRIHVRVAEYSHMGETPIRFLNSMPSNLNGLNRLTESPYKSQPLLDSIPGAADTKKCCAYTHFGRAFEDGGFEIMRHSHRQNLERTAETRFELVAQIPQPSKKRTHVVGIEQVGRNAHQAGKLQVLQTEDFFGQGWNFGFGNSALGLFSAEMNFDEPAQFIFSRCF